jgi:hypothetical protein
MPSDQQRNCFSLACSWYSRVCWLVHAKPDESLHEHRTTASAMVNQALATTTSAQMHPHIAMLKHTFAQLPCLVYHLSANDTLRCLSHHLRRYHETMKEK